MRGSLMMAAASAALLSWHAAAAQDSLNVCQVSSSYDVTLTSAGLLFDRATPAPMRVLVHDGQLQADGRPVTLDAADRQRMQTFEQTARALAPKVKAIALRGVDLAAEAVREQARESTPQLAGSGELDARLDAIAGDLKARIERSNSSHDWHGAAFQQYVNQHVTTIVPLLAGDLLQQAMQVAISGDLDGASELRDRAAHLADSLRARVYGKLAVLKPRIRELCPAVRKMDQLENGLDASLPDGSRLNLLSVGQPSGA